MERIIVIGSPGSGKSTLSKKMSEAMNLPLIHLDKLFWKDGWIESSNEEFNNKLMSELKKEKWIIDGNYGGTLSLRLSYADTAIFFDLARILCVRRVIKRVFKNHGITRSDMGSNCPEKFDLSFIKYTWEFKNNQRKKVYEKLEKAGNVKVIVIKSRRECREFEKKYLKQNS